MTTFDTAKDKFEFALSQLNEMMEEHFAQDFPGDGKLNDLSNDSVNRVTLAYQIAYLSTKSFDEFVVLSGELMDFAAMAQSPFDTTPVDGSIS